MKANFFKLFVIGLGFTFACSFSALGQTQDQQDRVNRVAQYLVTAPLCGQIGMKLDPNLPAKVQAALNAETAPWQVPTDRMEQLIREALSRQGKILSIDLDTAANAATSETKLRSLAELFKAYGRTCIAATNDTIFSAVITLPQDYDLETAATLRADELLEDGGFASWQTPRIQARGDLMTLAGICRSKIGAARSDALVRQFGQSEVARERNYYSKSFDRGLADPDTWTLADCNRAIEAKQAKAR